MAVNIASVVTPSGSICRLPWQLCHRANWVADFSQTGFEFALLWNLVRPSFLKDLNVLPHTHKHTHTFRLRTKMTNNFLTLYAPCIILQYVYKPTRCTKFLWLDFIFYYLLYVWLLCGYSHTIARRMVSEYTGIYQMRCTAYKSCSWRWTNIVRNM